MMTEVFNAKDTAPLAIEAILEAGSYDLGPKATRIEDPAEWTESEDPGGRLQDRFGQGRRGGLRRLRGPPTR